MEWKAQVECNFSPGCSLWCPLWLHSGTFSHSTDHRGLIPVWGIRIGLMNCHMTKKKGTTCDTFRADVQFFWASRSGACGQGGCACIWVAGRGGASTACYIKQAARYITVRRLMANPFFSPSLSMVFAFFPFNLIQSIKWFTDDGARCPFCTPIYWCLSDSENIFSINSLNCVVAPVFGDKLKHEFH